MVVFVVMKVLHMRSSCNKVVVFLRDKQTKCRIRQYKNRVVVFGSTNRLDFVVDGTVGSICAVVVVAVLADRECQQRFFSSSSVQPCV